MTVSLAQGGAEECVYSIKAVKSIPGYTPTTYNPGYVFAVMSNSLTDPKLVFCPADVPAKSASHELGGHGHLIFSTGSAPTPLANCSAFLSYFVGGDALDIQPQSIMAGDRNIYDTSGVVTAADAGAADGVGDGAGTLASVAVGHWDGLPRIYTRVNGNVFTR